VYLRWYILSQNFKEQGPIRLNRYWLWDDTSNDVYLNDVPSSVVLKGPTEAVKDLMDLVRLEYTEETVKEYLEADRRRLSSVQHETGYVKYYVRLYHLNLLQ